MDIRRLLGNKVIIFDGAMGSMLQNLGLETGEIPELFNFTHPEIIKNIHREYLAAGSHVVSTNTFGANRLKTEASGYTVDEIIAAAVKIAKEAVDEFNRLERPREDHPHFVALSLGPIGKLMAPTGDLEFEEACHLYGEQIEAGIKAGADLILFETQSDLYELKAAIVKARELTDLPIFCTVTFQENGRMLMGADPLTVVTMLQDLGIDALGLNCSLGPDQMLPLAEDILKYCRLPVMVQPNAGLPEMKDGKTVYNVGAAEYAKIMEEMVRAGVTVAGGCCGTTPEYIKELCNRIKVIDNMNGGESFIRTGDVAPYTAVCSAVKTIILGDRIRVIGERINPTGKRQLKEALMARDYSYIENEAKSQVEAGAEILDINVGLPGIDEEKTMMEVIKRVEVVTDAHLQIDSSDPRVIETAARYYNGRPIINSVNGKQEVMDAIFPIVKKYGTCVIALTLDEGGLPRDADHRVAIAERIIKEAGKYGIGRERIIVDCLTLTVSAQQRAGKDTLEAITRVKSQFGVKTTLGASNVSFGLPNRKLINSTFLAMALERGLDAPITDPLVPEYMDTIRAFETLSGKDADSRDFIAFYGTIGNKPQSKNDGGTENRQYQLADIISLGYGDRAAKATEELLEKLQPLEIIETVIIPALEKVGKEYETGEKFLPQLVQSADAVRPAFEVIKQRLAKGGQSISFGKIILATVKGDIHDIGKNIVKVLLENYGYDVIDLGKDTDIQLIVDRAKREDIKMVGLSALMTTTVINMEKTIKALKESGLHCKIAVGGAVLNYEYAKAIGADYYCKDAMDAVRTAKEIFKEKAGDI
jgi:5-methyltetrahydrofolate--homocysteine methyltransferase